MKKITDNGRKLLRKILMFLGVTSVSLMFVACYGMPMDSLDFDWEEWELNQQQTEDTPYD